MRASLARGARAAWSRAEPRLSRAGSRLWVTSERASRATLAAARSLGVRLEPTLQASRRGLQVALDTAWRHAGPHLVRARTALDERTDGRVSRALELTARHATRRRLWALAAVGLLLLALSLGSGSSAALRNAALHEARPGPVTIRLSERGELRALDSVTISSEADIPIIHLVPEGTQAKKGDLLVRFDPGKYEVALDEAKSARQVAEADLRRAGQEADAQREKLLAEIARYESEAQVAQLDLDELKKKPLPEDRTRAHLELDRARVAARQAQARLKVLPRLVDKGFVTKETMEEAELKAIASRADLQAAEVQYAKVEAGATPVELEKATMRLEQAKFALEKARSGMESQVQSYGAIVERERANVLRSQNLIEKAEVKLKRTELYAPRDGLVVYARGNGTGEQVALGMIPFEGQALLYLPDLAAMAVDTEVNEIDIGKVQIGGPAEVQLEAYPGTSFRAKVLKIGSLAKRKQGGAGSASGVKVFEVTAQIESQDARLKPGLSATVDIIVDRQESAIAVPLSAIVARGQDHLVLVSDDGTIEERKVVLGMSNEHQVVVKEGLNAGERVVVAPAVASE
jgi:HlyD family secretion protein